MIQRINNYYAKLSVPAKAAIVYLIVLILQKSLAFITTPIFSKLLTVNEYGEVSVFFSWQELIGIVAMFCLQGGVFNNGMVDFPEDRDKYTFSMLVLSNVLTIITAVVFLPINMWQGNILGLDTVLVALMFMYFIFQPALGFWTTKQRYEYKYKLSSVITLLYCFAAPIVSILFIVIFDRDPVHERLFGYVGTLILIYIPFYIYLGYKANFKVDTSYFAYALKFNIFLIPHYFSMYVLNSSDRIMIKSLQGPREAGLYSMAYTISALIAAITISIQQALSPYIYERCKENEYKKIREITNTVVILILAITVIVVVIGPEVLLLLSTNDYSEAIYVIPSIVIGVFFQSLYSIYASIVFYHKKTKYVMVGSILSSIINIVLNYMLIPKFGYIAAGYTTLFSYALQACIDIWAVKRVVGNEPYNLRLILKTSVFAISFAVVCPMFYDMWVVRYILLATFIVIVFLKRKRIIEVIKVIKR